MRLGAMSILERHVHWKSSKGWTVIAWHWPSSITWRWLLHWYPICRESQKRIVFHRTGAGGGIYLRLFAGRLGEFNFQTQDNMFRKKSND